MRERVTTLEVKVAELTRSNALFAEQQSNVVMLSSMTIDIQRTTRDSWNQMMTAQRTLGSTQADTYRQLMAMHAEKYKLPALDEQTSVVDSDDAAEVPAVLEIVVPAGAQAAAATHAAEVADRSEVNESAADTTTEKAAENAAVEVADDAAHTAADEAAQDAATAASAAEVANAAAGKAADEAVADTAADEAAKKAADKVASEADEVA